MRATHVTERERDKGKFRSGSTWQNRSEDRILAKEKSSDLQIIQINEVLTLHLSQLKFKPSHSGLTEKLSRNISKKKKKEQELLKFGEDKAL